MAHARARQFALDVPAYPLGLPIDFVGEFDFALGAKPLDACRERSQRRLKSVGHAHGPHAGP